MGKQTADFVPVSARALEQRINRKLAAQGEKLKRCRSDRWRHDLGDYYVINVDKNIIVFKQVNLEVLGRELGALAPYERLEDEA
jgi:hypothetical protein